MIANDKLIILDLDETLIHSSQLINKEGNDYDFTVGKFFVYKRPFVDEFIKFCLQNF